MAIQGPPPISEEEQKKIDKAIQKKALEKHIPDVIVSADGTKFLCAFDDGTGQVEKHPIAKGGMGMVAKAQNEKTKEVVAVRIPINQAESRTPELEREAHAYKMQGELKGIKPPTKEDPRLISLVELIPGKNLSDVMYTMVKVGEGGNQKEVPVKNNLSLEDKKAITYELLRQAYAKFQLRGLIHCDLKGDNVMYDDKSKTLKIVDLGETIDVADHVHEKHAQFKAAGQGYVAPEYRTGAGLQNSFRSDMYSMGVFLAELWSDTNYALEMAKGNDIPEIALRDILDPKSKPDVPPDILSIIRRLACPDPLLAPVNIAYAVAESGSKELQDITKAQMALEQYRKALKEDLVENINPKDKQYAASKENYEKAKHFHEIAEKAILPVEEMLKELQEQKFSTPKTDEEKKEKARIIIKNNKILDMVLKTLSETKDIHPEIKAEIDGILKLKAESPADIIKKINALYKVINKNLTNNPPPPLIAIESKDLATVHKHLSDYAARYPDNKASNYILEKDKYGVSLVDRLDGICLSQSKAIDQVRFRKIHEYPIVVNKIFLNLVQLAQSNQAERKTEESPEGRRKSVLFSTASASSSGFNSFGAKVNAAAQALKSHKDFPNIPVEKVEEIMKALKEATGATMISDHQLKVDAHTSTDHGKKMIIELEKEFVGVKDRGPKEVAPEQKDAKKALSK